MSYGVGLFGPHRSGKTTLARKFSEKYDLPFVQTSASATFARLGLDPAAPLDFDTRMRVQSEVLIDCAELYRQQQGAFITDRTPVDMVAYTLADIFPGGVSETQWRSVERYMRACAMVVNHHFTLLVGVQPGIPLVDEPGKAALDIGYMEKLNTLMLGFVVSEDVMCDHYFLPRRYLDLNQRISAVDWCVKQTMAKHIRVANELQEQGVVLH